MIQFLRTSSSLTVILYFLVDTYGPRLCVAIILTTIAPLVADKSIEELANFFVPEALADRKERVQNQMLGNRLFCWLIVPVLITHRFLRRTEAGIALVDIHGKKHITLLLNVFQSFLDEAPDSKANDVVRRSLIVLMGTGKPALARDMSLCALTRLWLLFCSSHLQLLAISTKTIAE